MITKFFQKLETPAFLISPPCWMIMKEKTLRRVATWDQKIWEQTVCDLPQNMSAIIAAITIIIIIIYLKAVSHHV